MYLPAARPARRLRGLQVSRPLAAEVWRWGVAVGVTALLLAGAATLTVAWAVQRQARTPQHVRADAIVVMGAAQYNGRPSPVLQARLDTALAAYEEGLAPVVILTGGNQAGDAYTEAGTGRSYLLDRGVPEEALLVDDLSTNSEGNLRNAARLARDAGVETVLIVSDGFHLFRSKLIARDVGLDPVGGLPADGSPIRPGSGTERGYVLRETAAVLVYKLL